MEEGVNTGHHRSKIAGHPKEEMDIFMFKKQIKQEMKPIHALRKSTRPRKQSQRMLDGAEDDESPPMKKPCKSFKINKHPDICKNGEPFKCSLCESPYINTSAAKAKKKLENEPIVKEVNGQLLELCVKCAIALNNTENKGPSPEEREMFEEEGKKFAQQLSEELGEPEAVRLYCSLYQTTKCGCIQLYINGTKAVKKRKNSFTTADISNPEVVDRDLSLEPPDDQADRSRKANFLLSLLKTSKAKKKLDSQKSIKSKLKKLSNEEVVNNKKDLETFILANRTKLKCLGICERGCQKVLCYSNNFLHKKLAVTGSKPRLEKTKGGVAEGRVPDLDRLATITCCEITCSQIALKENNRVAKWREQAQMSQKDMWQVIAEMLSFIDCEGKGRKCCYKFISLVTGCCQTTIQKVYVKTRLAKGDSTKPDHGMKSHWKKQKAETAGLPASKGMKSNVQTIESKSLQDAGTSSSGAGTSSMMASTVVTLEQRLPPVTGILQSSSSNVSVVTAMSCFNQRLEEPNMPASLEQRQVSGASLKDSLSTVSNDDEELYAHFSMFKHQVTEKRPELLELLNAIEDGLKNRKDSSSEMGPAHTFVPASLANVQVSSLSSSTPVPSCVSSKVPQAVLLDSVLTTAHSDQRRQTMTVVSSNRLSSVETSLASQSPAVPHVASQSPVVPHGHPRSVPVLKSPSAQGKTHTNAGSHFIKTLPVLTPKVLTGKQVASPMGSNLTGNQVSNDQMQLTSKLCWNQVSTPIDQTKLTSVEKLDALPHSDLLVSYLIPTSGGSQNPVQGQISTHSGTNMSCSVVTTSTGQLTTQAPSLTQDTLSVFLPNETLNLQHTKQVFPIDFNNTDNSSINYLFGASPAPGTNFIQVLAPQSLPDQRSINTVNGSSQSKIQGNAAASQSQPPAPASQYPGLFDALADSPVRELAQQPLPEAQPKRSYLPEMLMTSMNSTVAVSASSLQSNVADISTDGPSQSSTKTVASHLGSAQLTTSSHSSSAAHKISRTKEPPQVVIVNPYISGIETSDLSSILTTSQPSYSLPASQLTSTFQANENITVQLGAQQPHLSNLGNQQTLQLITSMSNPPQAANQLLTPFIQARTNTNVLISQNMNTGNHSANVLNIAPGNPSPSNPSSNATLNIPPGNTTLNNISANSVVNIATGNQTLAISQSNPTLTIPQSNPTFTIPQSNPTFTIPQTNPTLTVPQGNPSADLTNMTLLSLGNQLYQLVPNTLTGQLQLIPFICANTSATPVSQYVLNLSPGTTSSFQAASDPVSTLSTDTTHQYQQGVTLVSPPFPSNQTASQAPRHVLPNSRSGVGNQQAEQQPSTGATYISNLGDANHNQLLVPVSSSETNALNNSLVTLIPHQSGLLSSQFVPNQQQIMVSNLQDTTNNPNQQLIQWTTSGQGQASLGVESGQGSSASHVLFENQPVDTQKLVSEFILSSLCQNSDRNFLSQQLAPVSNPNSFVTISNLNPKQASSTHQNTVLKSMIDSKSKSVACPTDGISKPASFPASEINQIHGAMSQLKVLLQGSDTSQANSIANQTNAWQLNVEATDNARKSYQQSSSDSSSVPSQPQLKANVNPSMNANNQITKQVAGSSSLSSNTVNASNSRLLLDHLQKLPANSSVNCVQENMQKVLRENTQSHTGHQIRLRESAQSFSNQARLTEHTQMDHQAMLRENTLSHTDQQVELQDNKSTTQQSKATVLVQPQNVHIFMSPPSGSGKDEDKLCLQKVSEDKRSEVIPLLMAYLHGNPNVSCEVTPSQDFCSPGPSGTDIKENQLRQALGNNKCPSTVVTISTNQEFVESLGKGESGVNSSYLAGEFDAGQNVSSSTSSSPSEAYTYQCSTSHAVQVVPASGHASSTLSQSLYTYTTASADATNSDRSCPAFIRATNTPTDAVGPPNITVMSPSRHSSSHIPRLRADTCRTTSATFPLSDTVGVAMPNQSTKAGLQLLSHPSSNKSQSGMSVTSASFASVIGTPMSNPSSTNLSRVPATSQANVKVVGGSMPAHRNISVSVSSHSTQKPGSVLPASQLTLVSSSQATLPAPAASHSKASTNYITPKPASTPTSHATSAKILEERFKLNCNQTKPRNRPYTVLQLLQQQEKEQALASQGPTSSAASSVGTTSMPSQTSTASLPLYTTANVLSGTQPIPTPAGPLTLVIPIPAASQVFTKDGSENRALFGQISFNSSNTGVAILQPNPLQPSPTTQGSTLVLKKAISQPHQDNSNQPTSHSNTGSPAPNLASKIGPDPLTLPKLSNSTAFTPTHSKSISGSTASTLTASKLAPKTLKLQTPTSIACNLATQSSLPPFEANIKLIGQPQVSGNTSAINKKLNEKSLKLRSLTESQVQLNTNTNKPDFKPQDRKPGEDPHSRPGSVESTASTHSSHLDSPYPSKQHVLLLKRSQVNSTASGANLTYYADDTHKVKVHLQDNGADKVQFFQMDQLNDDAAFRNMEQFNSTHISHHTNPTNTLPSNSTYALPINSNSLPIQLKTTNSLPTHLNITDHYKDKKSLPSQNPLLANILFESSQNISTNTQQTLSDAGVRMLSSHNKATLERASQGVFFQKSEAELSGPKINPSFDQWSRSCHPSGSEIGALQSPTNTLSRLLSASVPENTPSRRIEKVINDIYKFPDDVEDAPNAVRYQSDLPDNMGSVQKKHGSQFDRSKANVPFTDDLCIDNSSESSMFKHSKHGHEKIISPKTTTKINLKKVQFSDEIGNSSLPTEVNSLNMVHSTPYNSLSLVSRNSSEDKVYKSESRNNNFMYKEDHEELSLNQAVLKGTMSHRGGPKDSKLKALLSSKPDGTFALRYAEESLSESGVLISGVGFKKMNKDDACSGEYPKDLANTSNYSRSKFYSDQRYEELCSPIESASKHLLPSDPQDFASNSSFEILSPKGYSKLSGQRGKTLPNVVYMEDNSESGSQEARYEMGKSSTFFRKEIEESVERQNLERSQLLKSNFELAQQMNQNTEKSYAKFQSPYVEFHNYGELNYGEINSASKDDASNDMATEYVEAIQKSGKDGRSHGEENKLVYKARLDHLSPHEDGIHKKHMPSSGILKPSPLPECEPFKQVDGQRVRHPSGVKNVEDFSYLDSRHRSAGPHKSFGDLADGIRSRDPLVSFSSMSRHEADSSPQHERQRYPSAEFLALDSSRHRTTTQMFKFNDQDPPSYDISQRQRNPSSSSLKAFFLSDSEFPNFDGGNRSRNPSSSSLMKLEFIEHSFHPIRSRNPSGSSTRRSRPGSSSSDREFHMNNFDELPIFSDVMRTRSRNSSGESLEPTIDTIILDPNFQNYVRHKF